MPGIDTRAVLRTQIVRQRRHKPEMAPGVDQGQHRCDVFSRNAYTRDQTSAIDPIFKFFSHGFRIWSGLDIAPVPHCQAPPDLAAVGAITCDTPRIYLQKQNYAEDILRIYLRKQNYAEDTPRKQQHRGSSSQRSQPGPSVWLRCW